MLLRGATSGQLGQVADACVQMSMSAPGIQAQAPTNGFTCWPFPRLVVQSASFPHNVTIILAARSLAVGFSTPFHAVQSINICEGCCTGRACCLILSISLQPSAPVAPYIPSQSRAVHRRQKHAAQRRARRSWKQLCSRSADSRR